jgi:hypothetical protein
VQLVDPQKDPPPYPLSQQQPGAAQPLPLELEMHADLRASWDAYHKLPASNSLTVSFQALQSGITVAVVSGRHAGRIFFFCSQKAFTSKDMPFCLGGCTAQVINSQSYFHGS